MHRWGTVFSLAVCCSGASAQPIRSQPKAERILAPSLEHNMAASPGRPLRVWVFFTDKAVMDSRDLRIRLDARAAELGERTLARRALRGAGGRADYSDLPIHQNYIDALRAAGAKLRHQSRWLNAASLDASAAQLRAIAELPFVRYVQPVARAARRLPTPELPPADAEPRGVPTFYGESDAQLNQIGVVAAHNAGYTGSGIIIGVLDTGFNRTHQAFNQTTGGAHPVQVIAEFDFVDNDGDTTQQPGDPANQAFHGTYILGALGAYYPTVLVGGAYDASFLLAKTEDISQEVPAEEDNYVAGLEWIENGGADLATSSLGYIDWYTQADLDGATAVTTIAVNIATANGLVCCTAAGNGGNDANPVTSRLLAPADALRVLACGAVDASGFTAFFSSDGPTADGRVKPELLARGVNTRTVSFSSNTNIIGADGTSLSTPLLAAGAALVVQAHPNWSVDKIRRALLHTASGFLSTATFDPLYVRGYGLVNVNAAINHVHGDVDGDGRANARDIAPFITALLGTNPDPAQRRRADADASGSVTPADLPIFVNDLLGL
jgi:serine protease AprX